MALVVCKASAGSGKTHKLTHEYLKLILPNPTKYRHVVAVTFTNKATEEMKQRIIEELYRLVTSPASSHHIADLILETEMDQDKISVQAKKALQQILYDYSRFQITTIDSFFQQAIRSFIRELGIHGNFRLEFQEDLVLQEAVDALFVNLDREENSQLYDWLYSFYLTITEEGDSWNIKKKIVKLAKQLSRENYKEASIRFNERPKVDHTALTSSIQRIKEFQKEFEEELLKRCIEFVEQVNRSGLAIDSDFNGKSRSPLMQIVKVSKQQSLELNSTLFNWIDNPEAWSGKSSKKQEEVLQFYEQSGNALLKELQTFYEVEMVNYATAQLILKNIYILGILSNVKNEIDEYSKENNALLISQTSELLNGIIDGSSTPFVYEKIATRIENYMIDEFQDTSNLQWSNFRPLIEESLSQHESFGLIVGDVKQSIYRWRDSNWQLLAHRIKAEFPNYYDQQSLTENRRSKGRIIRFNNRFFDFSQRAVQEKLDNDYNDQYHEAAEAYADVEQNNPDPRQEEAGFLRVELIDREEYQRLYPESDGDGKLSAAEFMEIATDKIPAIIEDLATRGYQGGDVGILVRRNIEARIISRALLQYRQKPGVNPALFNIISPEGLLLNNAQSISILISILHYLNDQQDQVSQIYADKQGGVHRAADLFKNAPVTAQELRVLPLYQLIDQLIAVFLSSYLKSESLFIQSFQDLVFDFISKESSDLNSFLSWWEENSSRFTLQLPEDSNSIRIMTVHASKGLGFKAVIIPFANWEINKPGNEYLWCSSEKELLDIGLPIPIRTASAMAGTEFAEAYENEMIQSHIDALNTTYVAFTRAKECMVILSQNDPIKGKINSLSQLLTLFLSNQESTEGNRYTLGESWKNPKPDNQSVDNSSIRSAITPSSWNDRVKIKLKGANQLGISAKRQEGILLHEIMGGIRQYADIDDAIRKVHCDQPLPSEEFDRLKDKIDKMIQNPLAQEWFGGSYEVYNEQEILIPSRNSYRPDRIMVRENEVIVVDYKFGDQINSKYEKQVGNYLRTLEQIYPNACLRGYIWYPVLDKVIIVTL